MGSAVPYDRTAPQDFYRQIDRIREAWDSDTEPEMTRKLQRLRRTCDVLPGRYYEQVKPLIAALGYCRLQMRSPYQARLVDLTDAIRAWAEERARRIG